MSTSDQPDRTDDLQGVDDDRPAPVAGSVPGAEPATASADSAGDSAAEAAGPSDDTADSADSGESADGEAERLPWPAGYEFGKQDGICASLIGLMTIYGLAMIPLRPVILGLAPIVLVSLTGSMLGLVMCGALGSTGWPWWPAALIIGTLSAIKFDFVWWWAGKLWGDHFIASIAGQTERARRRAKRAENLTRRYDILALGLGHVPYLPVPRSIVCAVLGAAGSSIKRLFIINTIFSAIVASTFLYLGWQIGEPAVAVLEEFGKYTWYVSIVLLVVVFYIAFRSAKKSAAAKAG